MKQDDFIQAGGGGDRLVCDTQGAAGPVAAKMASKMASKKRYVTPSFEYEQAFETMALACGKINTTQAQCKFNRKNS